jgi:hypothetical protein
MFRSSPVQLVLRMRTAGVEPAPLAGQDPKADCEPHHARPTIAGMALGENPTAREGRGRPSEVRRKCIVIPGA